jgi:hypothetical protein
VLHAASRPVRARVVSAAPGVGTAGTERRTAYVDQRRVVRADVVDVEVKAAASVGPKVHHEHVGRLEQPRQHGASFRVLEIDAQRALAAVGGLEERIHASVHVVQTRGHEAAVRVTGQRVLDLQHLGPPLGEHGALHRDEDVRRDLDDPHAA